MPPAAPRELARNIPGMMSSSWRRLAALAAALCLAGCGAPLARAALRADRAALAAERSPPAPSPFGVDATGAIHVHTRLSHDSPAALEEVVRGARAAGLRWVCLTDHQDPETAAQQPRGEVGGVLVIPGEERTEWGGALLVLGASRSMAGSTKGLRPAARDAAAVGRVVLLGHLLDFPRPPRTPVDGIAVYDLTADFRSLNPLRLPSVVAAGASGDADALAEAYLLFALRRPAAHLAVWDERLAAGPAAGVAETNAHGKFRYLGLQVDPFGPLFALVRNHAVVEEESEDGVLDAVRRGRLHVGFDAVADSSGFRFEALAPGGGAAAMGEAVDAAPGLAFAIHLPLPADVRLLRDGIVVRSGRGRVLHWPSPGPGVYRVEATLDAGGRALPWILSNPIRVR